MSIVSTSAPAAARVAPAPVVAKIASLDQEGRGIARIDGKAVFVEARCPARS